MSRRNVDEAAGPSITSPASPLLTASHRSVLKLYGISSLNPQEWEDVDHEKEGPLAGTMTGEDGGMAEEMDPLGLRGRLTGSVSLSAT
jgi:hypothetical protein